VDKKELIDFSNEIIKLYEQGKIKAPIHLSDGTEDKLIKIFQQLYNPGDWIFSTWRSHFHWLLSGRRIEELKLQILEGHSMHIFDKKFFTSSIVAGISPIALGVAHALKQKESKFKVLCFLGDMAASIGLSMECFKYASGHNLPIVYIIENNGLSVTTPTEEVWGDKQTDNIHEYYYERVYNHAGIGENGKTKFVLF